MSGDIPSECPTCDTRIVAGSSRCPGCGKVFGEDNRCGACGAHAAVRETAPASYVCAACGAPRQRLPGTVVDSDLAKELDRRAGRSRFLGTVLGVVSSGVALVGLTIAGISAAFLPSGWDLGFGLFGGLVLLLGVAGMRSAQRSSKSASGYQSSAVEEKLLLTAQRQGGAVTVTQAARALSMAEPAADAVLTRLAKEGRVQMDVDDEGVIRYRVDTSELYEEEDEPAPQSRKRGSE